ncbi:dihydroneopterin aldolase [Leptolyngbya sp. 'hensonii']|uniref:dihydroneopterin aldolase n=1 Tax=Leptolyngbya sp. 'hensonii' TaxID=1922337 RepID=UPI00094F77BE|nr:dihydroneopterin aldolase [Leptolyngbya sp. 'hensonii']OLP16824.1 dihydroneopterin aldolase [Leptolyngbya sp. 'hensonii']
MDCIRLTGIRCYGYSGALPEEQVLGQWFEVDLALWKDLTQAGRSDRLEHTLDYRQIIAIVRHIITTEKFALIERLATVIVEQILELESVEQVGIRLTKVAAPIPDFTGQVSIELTRQRGYLP